MLEQPSLGPLVNLAQGVLAQVVFGVLVNLAQGVLAEAVLGTLVYATHGMLALQLALYTGSIAYSYQHSKQHAQQYNNTLTSFTFESFSSFCFPFTFLTCNML